MTTDIFSFWKRIGPKDKIHPADEDVLCRVGHGFDLRCLPGPFMGPLRTAPVVLLYLSPGLSPRDADEANIPEVQEWYAEQRGGNAPLPSEEDHPDASRWVQSRTQDFGEWENIRDKVAVLNIGAYHSEGFNDHSMLAALPSCQVALSWAQSTLFPAAEQGQKIVICMRSAKYWGLSKGNRPGKKYGEALYAPRVTPGGYMVHDECREGILEVVRSRLNP